MTANWIQTMYTERESRLKAHEDKLKPGELCARRERQHSCVDHSRDIQVINIITWLMAKRNGQMEMATANNRHKLHKSIANVRREWMEWRVWLAKTNAKLKSKCESGLFFLGQTSRSHLNRFFLSHSFCQNSMQHIRSHGLSRCIWGFFCRRVRKYKTYVRKVVRSEQKWMKLFRSRKTL